MHNGLRTEIRLVFGVWGQAAVMVVAEAPKVGWCAWLGDGYGPDDSAAIVAEVQVYLWSRVRGGPPPTEAAETWKLFYERYDRTFRQLVEETRTRFRTGFDREDLIQEVWLAVSAALRRLQFDPGKGSLDALLTIVARRAVRRAIRRSCKLPPMQAVDESLASCAPGPPVACCAMEALNAWHAALRELRAETSELNYELFSRRYLDGESLSGCAESLGLTPRAVHGRCGRTRRRLRELLARFDEGLT